MKKITISQFQEEGVAVLDHLGSDGILITKKGKPFAKIVPTRKSKPSLIGSLKKKIKIKGNIFSTGSTWNAES